MDSKNILKSKTFWFNLAAGLFALLEKTTLDLGITDGWLVMILSVGNMLLRTVTTQPVKVLPV